MNLKGVIQSCKPFKSGKGFWGFVVGLGWRLRFMTGLNVSEGQEVSVKVGFSFNGKENIVDVQLEA